MVENYYKLILHSDFYFYLLNILQIQSDHIYMHNKVHNKVGLKIEIMLLNHLNIQHLFLQVNFYVYS